MSGYGLSLAARELLDLLLAPTLPGAACAGRSPYWDDEVPDETDDERTRRLDAARSTCTRCPARNECAVLAASLPRRRGVWAGELHTARPRGRPVPPAPSDGTDDTPRA